MAVTRLERKGRKNKSRAKARVTKIKRLSATPVIKNVDVEAIKEEFAANKKPAKAEKPEKKAAEPKAEKVEEVKAEVKTEEKKEKAPKKAAAKKTEEKEEKED